MPQIDPQTVLYALIRHETLSINDLEKVENLGMESSPEDLQPVLDQLAANGLVTALADVKPATYTITDKGISEGEKQSKQVQAQ